MATFVIQHNCEKQNWDKSIPSVLLCSENS